MLNLNLYLGSNIWSVVIKLKTIWMTQFWNSYRHILQYKHHFINLDNCVCVFSFQYHAIPSCFTFYYFYIHIEKQKSIISHMNNIIYQKSDQSIPLLIS